MCGVGTWGRGGRNPAGRPRSLQLTSPAEDMRPERQPRPVPASQCLQLASRPPLPSDGGSSHAGPSGHTHDEWGVRRGLGRTRPRDPRPSGSTAEGTPSYWPLPCWDHEKHAVITKKKKKKTKNTTPALKGEAAGLPGRFEDWARPGRLQPSPSPAPGPTPRRLPAPPLQAAHSARPLPAPGPPPMGCSHCAASPSAASSQPKMAAAAATELLRRLPQG